MELSELKKLLARSWSAETASPGVRDNWSEDNPSLGQGAITALIVNDYFGGKIMRCNTSQRGHYYNLVGNEIVDLTSEQFLGEIPQYEEGEERTRDYLLSNENTRSRYKKLLQNLKAVATERKYKLIGADGKEYYSSVPGNLAGNKKLKIYGKLDCPSALRWIEKGYYVKNRVFFESEEIAVLAGYRPCAICMPEAYEKWKVRSRKLTSE